MIRSFFFREGRLQARDLPLDELKLTWAETPSGIVWFDLHDPTSEEAAAVLEGVFAFHPLTIEDCLMESPYPKVEDYGDYLYVVLHAVDLDAGERFTTTELDLFLGKNFLVTLHWKPLRSVEWMVERAGKLTAPLRGPDRLAHQILDQLVAVYEASVGEIRRDVEGIEAAVLGEGRGGLEKTAGGLPVAASERGGGRAERMGQPLIERIVRVRSEVASLRRTLRLQREAMARLAAGGLRVIRPAILPYLRDLQDDLLRLEAHASGWQDSLILSFKIHLNRSSAEANRGIKVLTALTALAIPLIVISTWFSMNFPRMPGLDSQVGYWAVMAIVLAGTGAMWWWLRRNQWI